jgi:hypothetical protein
MTPQVINYLISIGLLSFAAGVLIKKRKEQPGIKLFGLPLSTLIMLNFSAITLFAVLLILSVMGIAR